MKEFIKGDLGLAKTYWLFGVVGSLVISLISRLFISIGSEPIIFIIIILAYSAVLWIAIWNSATKYEGEKIWAILAKIVVVLGVLRTLSDLTNNNY
jgi:hypothetical protein